MSQGTVLLPTPSQPRRQRLPLEEVAAHFEHWISSTGF